MATHRWRVAVFFGAVGLGWDAELVAEEAAQRRRGAHARSRRNLLDARPGAIAITTGPTTSAVAAWLASAAAGGQRHMVHAFNHLERVALFTRHLRRYGVAADRRRSPRAGAGGSPQAAALVASTATWPAPTVIRPCLEGSSRLVARLDAATTIRPHRVRARLLAWGDLVMTRTQPRTLKRLAERDIEREVQQV